ncbi:hypothetical protein ACHAPA_004973 [Fusarium lateritium]
MGSFKSSPRPQIGVEASNGRLGFVDPVPLNPSPPEGFGAADMTTDTENVRLLAVSSTARTLGIETSVSTYRDLALSLIEDCPLKRDLVLFVDAERQTPQDSLVPIDAFTTDSDRTDWHIHCPEMARMWKDFCEKVTLISEDKVAIDRMAAPSGPKKARATFLWHYPTDTSPNQVFSHVMDPESPSLRVQKIKNGSRGDVKTLDLIPIRVPYKTTGPQWEETYTDQWSAIHQTCVDFAQDALKDDEFIFAVGGEVFPYLKRMVKSWGFTLTWLELNVNTKMWEKAPRIYIARDSNHDIRKVIVWTFHGQFSFSNRKANVGAIWDLLYNAGYELAEVPISNYGYFEWKAGATRRRNWSDMPGKVEILSERDMYKALVEKETAEQKPCTIEYVRQCFPSLLEKTPGLLEEIKIAVEEKGYSPLNPIMRIFVGRQQATRTSNLAAKRKIAPPPAPKPKKVVTEKMQAYIDSDILSAAQKRGNDTKQAIVRSKYEAFMASFEVRQAEANRLNPNKPTEHARALPRIDAIKASMTAGTASGKFKDLGLKLSHWVVFYSKEYPRGYRYSMDGGPVVTEPDRYNNQRHPAISIMNTSYFRNAAARLSVAGPVHDEEEEYEDEEQNVVVRSRSTQKTEAHLDNKDKE